MKDLNRNEKLKYAHKRIQDLAIELVKVQKIMNENTSNLQSELIAKAIMCLVRCDNLNHVDQDLDKYGLIDGMSTHKISSQL